ncbi:hypothetical protein predicted by Glimmer/Critica [Salmonella enterica subsp. enterica serovar Weltevreden str. 2007-60-3289-1]|nr:hypothetical protein predicted by Glimmer/Critica [Salmonella enterica subsp. enterica serovar Weltevreden str. 2007-60-3289-1]
MLTVKFARRGLSPLARGTPHPGGNAIFHARFIPAGAGNTKIFGSASRQVAVYPRWRGEHELIIAHNRLFTGLSPLARGTHPSGQCPCARGRFIPAGAGNTLRRPQPGQC